jgi:hypothetical protein
MTENACAGLENELRRGVVVECRPSGCASHQRRNIIPARRASTPLMLDHIEGYNSSSFSTCCGGKLAAR